MDFTLPTKTYSLPDGSTPISKPSKIARVQKKTVKKESEKQVLRQIAKESAALYGVDLHDPEAERKKCTPRFRTMIFKRDCYTCQKCQAKRGQKNERGEAVRIVLGHLLPIAAGGKTNDTNCIAECHDCNAGAGAARDFQMEREIVPDPKAERTPEQLSAAYDWRNKKDSEIQGVVEGVKKGKVK